MNEFEKQGAVIPLRTNLRLLPKASNARPIVNLRGVQGCSANQSIYDVFNVVGYERIESSILFGSSVVGMDEVYKKLTPFLVMHFQSGKEMHFVSLDIKGAYDSIPHERLTQVIEKLFSQEHYVIQKIKELGIVHGRTTLKMRRKVYPLEQYPDFTQSAHEIANTSAPGKVLIDTVTYSIADRPSLKKRLVNHICRNIIKFRSNYYLQKAGIPQGSVLSSLLCSFFLADHELSCIPDEIKSGPSILIRYIDDSLYISDSIENCKRFVRSMETAQPTHSFEINRGKSIATFEIDGHAGSKQRLVHREGEVLFPWCGLLINTRDGQIYGDFDRQQNTGRFRIKQYQK